LTEDKAKNYASVSVRMIEHSTQLATSFPL